MLKAIQRFFDTNMHPDSEAITDREATDHALRLATAALLIEVMHADHQVSAEEREVVVAAIGERFRLSPSAAADLVELAEEEARQATSLFEFTHLIDKGFSPAQKIQVVELLWQVVFADRVLEQHEEALVRRISGLIHVPHKAFIDAKLRVRDARLHGGGL